MLGRVIMTLLVCATNYVLSQGSMLDSDAFIPYDDARQMIFRGNVNVIMGGDSHLNVIEYDPAFVKVTQLPGDVIEVSPKSTSKFRQSLVPSTVVVRSNDRFKSLYKLSIRDSSSLIAKDLESGSLAIDVKTTGNVMIEGVMNLNHLRVTESSDVEIYWVDSHDLDVSIEKGHVVLAGRTEFLTLKGQDNAEIDASGLIAKRSWVSGIEGARIAIFPTQELFAYTKDNSVIDVKQKPKVYAPVNQAPSAIVLNYVEMERRASAAVR